ncbi:MAG: hypothetical protein ACRESO_00575, partial [Gammaproteobacteria bacterium]
QGHGCMGMGVDETWDEGMAGKFDCLGGTEFAAGFGRWQNRQNASVADDRRMLLKYRAFRLHRNYPASVYYKIGSLHSLSD